MGAGDNPYEMLEFGTDGWRAAGEAFTLDRVGAIGRAVATLLDERDATGPVAVGYDARDGSRDAADQLAAAVARSGRDVTVSDRDCPTPALAWTVRSGDYAGGLMVTASHNPPEYNGVKYVTETGSPALPATTDALEDILATLETEIDVVDLSAIDREWQAQITEVDLRDPYCAHAESFVDADLDGVEIGYDAMHGSGRGVTNELLEDCGATVTSYRCTRDPTFGGTPPEPLPEHAEQLLTAVNAGDVDLGFINDGDADRLGVVTPERGFLDPNVLLAVLYEYLLDRSEPGDAVRTVSTSSLIDRVAREAGQAVHETAVGFKWVAAAMGEHDAVAGGEESGGYGIGAHLHNKDGVLLALLLAAAHTERPLDDRIDALIDAHGQIVQDRRSIDCPDDQKAAVIDALDGAVPDRIAGTEVAGVQTVDGFKIRLVDDSWLLVRPSGTEPKLRVYAEAPSEDRVTALLDAGEQLLRAELD
jgi:alpha-D-glucose phosphate-specific phosphoglucomutase